MIATETPPVPFPRGEMLLGERQYARAVRTARHEPPSEGLLQFNQDISIPPAPFVDRAVDLALLPERDVAGFHAAADVAALLLGY